jgi:hypothetical protein
MRRIILLALMLCSFMPTTQAAFQPSGQHKLLYKAQTAIADATRYMQQTHESHSIKGFESFMGRKLTRMERVAFKQLNKPDLSPEDEVAMQRNKRLATWSMVMGIAGIVFMFLPVVSALSILLLPAALVTGIIALNRSRNFEASSRNNGSTNAIVGIVTGSVGVLILILAIALLVALL